MRLRHCARDVIKNSVRVFNQGKEVMMEYSATVADALSTVWQLGQTDKCEHFVLVRGDQQMLKVDGDRCSVNIKKVAECFRQGDEFIHNHPVEASLSAQDLMTTARFGGTVYAITPNGSIYKASVKTSPGFLDDELWFARMRLQSSSLDEWTPTLQHGINLELHKKGLIAYEFEINWGSKT